MTHEIIVKVPDTQLDFFKELLNNLKISFQTPVQNKRTKVAKNISKPLTTEQQTFVEGLRESFKEAQSAERGDIQLRTLSDFLDELDLEVESSVKNKNI